MMITNDERHEVAVRLRECYNLDFSEQNIWWTLQQAAYDGDLDFVNYAPVDLFIRLADLIEPINESTKGD